MKKLWPLLLLLSGCGMSRQQTIDAVNQCSAAGMEPRIVFNELNQTVTNVLCFPKGTGL